MAPTNYSKFDSPPRLVCNLWVGLGTHCADRCATITSRTIPSLMVNSLVHPHRRGEKEEKHWLYHLVK